MNISGEAIIIVVFLVVLLITVLLLYVRKIVAYKNIYNKYKDVIDIDKEVVKSQTSLEKLQHDFDRLDKDFKVKSDKLNTEYQGKRDVYEKLLKEISILEENVEFISYGVYKPHYNFDTSEQYKNKLDAMRQDQKQLIKDKDAIVCPTEWAVEGSKREGRKMTRQYMKLMLRAFNNECDASVLKVKWNNILKMEERLTKAFDAINTLGVTQNISITDNYYLLKKEELRLAYEYQKKLYDEKEEQKHIREQMREEERVRQEIEKAKKDAEEDEIRYGKALEKAREEVSKVQGEKLNKLNSKIAELQKRLQEAQANKERAISRAQMTKSGHIYVISNIGSFGDNVYKIGMTRRLDPMDRVRELGDASVPFRFDVHAMIYSEHAPDLETALHKIFDNKRVNMVNQRKEFYNVLLSEIERAVKEKHGEIEFTKLAEAREHRETVAIHEQEKNKKTIEETVEEQFPSSL